MPRHRTLPPIVQKRGLVQNLLDQLGMVGPWRWQLVETIQPVIIVAEQEPGATGRRYAYGALTISPSASESQIILHNPAGSGVRMRVQGAGAVVDQTIGALIVRTVGNATPGGATAGVWRSTEQAGAPAGELYATGAVANVALVQYLESNPRQGTNIVQIEPYFALLGPDQGIGINAPTMTGNLWVSYRWSEENID